MTRVLIIDDHPVVLEGCRKLLKFAGAKETVETQTLGDGFRLYRSYKPDVIILDLAMRSGALGGLSFIRRLRLHDRRTPILVFSMHNDPFIIGRALKIGANGYILKDTPSEEILEAFDRVRRGLPYLGQEIASEVAFLEAQGGSKTNPLGNISVRELQILSLIADGKSYSEIAEELHISYKTVANACGQLKTKLGVKSLSELMRIAIEHLPSARGRT